MLCVVSLFSSILFLLHAACVQSLVTATITTTSTVTTHTSSSTSSPTSQCTIAQSYTNGLSVSDFGSCPNAAISYSFDPPSNQITYYPVNNTHFNVLPSTDLAFIESSICNYLGSSSCNADLAAIDLCWAAFWLYSGLVGGYGVGIWNEVMGLPGSHVPCTSSYSSGLSTVTTTTSTSFTTVVVVSTYVRSTHSDTSKTTITESVTSVSTKTHTYSTNVVTTETVTQPLVMTTRLTTVTLPVPAADATVTSASLPGQTSSAGATSGGVTDSNPFSVDGAPSIQNDAKVDGISLGLLTLCLLGAIFGLRN